MFFENKRFKTRRRRPRRRQEMPPIEAIIDVLLKIAEEAVAVLPIKLDLSVNLEHNFGAEVKIVSPKEFDAPLMNESAVELKLTRLSAHSDVQSDLAIDLTQLKKVDEWALAPLQHWANAVNLNGQGLWEADPFSYSSSLYKPDCWPREYCEEHIGICYDGPLSGQCQEGYCLCLPRY